MESIDTQLLDKLERMGKNIYRVWRRGKLVVELVWPEDKSLREAIHAVKEEEVVVGAEPSTAGYLWCEELEGWLRPWLGNSEIVKEAQAPKHWRGYKDTNRVSLEELRRLGWVDFTG